MHSCAITPQTLWFDHELCLLSTRWEPEATSACSLSFRSTVKFMKKWKPEQNPGGPVLPNSTHCSYPSRAAAQALLELRAICSSSFSDAVTLAPSKTASTYAPKWGKVSQAPKSHTPPRKTRQSHPDRLQVAAHPGCSNQRFDM